MKNQFHFLLFISCTLHTVLAQEKQPTHKEQDFSICYELKKIDPDAPNSHFTRLARRFANNKVTTCKCMHYLMDKKQEKALDLLAQKLNKDDFDSIKHAYKTYNDNKKEELEPGDLYVHVEPYCRLSQETKQIIHDIFPTVTTFQLLNDNIYDSFLQTISQDGNHLLIGWKFLGLPRTAMQSALLHEKKHLTNNDTFIYSELLKLAQKLHHSDDDDVALKDETLRKLARITESEADRIPTACGSCKSAQASIDLLEIIIKDTEVMHEKFTHPASKKRIAWAKRIYKSKAAERIEDIKSAYIRRRFFIF